VSALVLLTAADCHLCEHGKQVLDELGAPWREVDGTSAEGERLAAVAPPMRPVLFASDGGLIAYGRLSLKKLRRQLGREAVRA
jgi:glutaredoxin